MTKNDKNDKKIDSSFHLHTTTQNDMDQGEIDISLLIRKKREEIWEAYYENITKFNEACEKEKLPRDMDEMNKHFLYYIRSHRSEIRAKIISSIDNMTKNGLSVDILTYMTILDDPIFSRIKSLCDQYDQSYMLRIHNQLEHFVDEMDNVYSGINDLLNKEVGIADGIFVIKDYAILCYKSDH